MTALNHFCFSQKHWRMIANGIDIEAWFADGQVKNNGGIFNPQPDDVALKHRLYRLASSQSSEVAQKAGGWWISYEDFRKIQQFAQQHGYRFDHAARLFLALPYEWSRLDRLVTAYVVRPLRAYFGKGKTANSAKDGKFIPNQHNAVKQMYIPGLFNPSLAPDDTRQLYLQAFQELTVETYLGSRVVLSKS